MMRKHLLLSLLAATFSMAYALTEAEFEALYKRTDKDAEACYQLYEAYRDGSGVKKDETKARKWLLGAHKLGKPVYNEIASLPWRKKAKLKNGRMLMPKYKPEVIREQGELLSKAADGDHPEINKAVNENPKAIGSIKLKLMRSMLAAGADPNHQGKKTNVPMGPFCNSETPNYKILKMFIEAGADVHAHDSAAVDRALVNTSEWVPTTGKQKAVYQKRRKNYAAKIAFMLKNGLDVKLHDTSGATIMCIGALRGNSHTIELLAKAGADPNAKCSKYEIAGPVSEKTYYDTLMGIKEGNTPLHYCVGMPYVEKVEALLKYGADPEIANDKGETPMDYARRNLQKEDRPEYRERLEKVIAMFEKAIEEKKNGAASAGEE